MPGRNPLACLLILTGITTSRCQSPHRATPPATQGRPAPLRAAADPPDDPGMRLTAALDGYLANRPGRVSVAAADHGSGLVATYHANLRFETASIVKVDVLATLLLVAQDAHRELTQTERSLARLGTDHLDLVLSSGYVSKLIGNARVVRYLAQHHHEILTEFQKIAGMEAAAA